MLYSVQSEIPLFYKSNNRSESKVMKSVNIQLSSIEDVRNFTNIVNKYDIDVDLSSGRYIVDAKSIMGIFSLDLMKPITLTAHADDCDALMSELKQFIV